jgi:hypothetical protein
MGKPIILNSTPGKGQKIARVDATTAALRSHLKGIADWFEEPKITLIVRTEKGGDLIMTNDIVEHAVAALVAVQNKPKPN